MDINRNRLCDAIKSQKLGVMMLENIDQNRIYLKGNIVNGTLNVLNHSFEGIDYQMIVAIYYNENYGRQMCNLYLNNIQEDKNIVSIYTDSQWNENYTDMIETNYFAIEMQSIKKYCIELMEKYNNKTDRVELWINYIQNCSWCRLPNIPETTCLGLGGIFGLLHSLLSQIEYVGDIYLEDDSQFLASCTIPGQGLPTVPLRLLGAKKSIYELYGFVPVDQFDNPVSYEKLVDEIKDTVVNWNLNGLELTATPAFLVKNYFKDRIIPEASQIYNQFVQTVYKLNHSREQMGPMYQIRKILERMRCTNFALWACRPKK